MTCVNSIELDDEQSDAESTDSTTGVFADIPLPSTTTTSSAPAIPLPHSISTDSSSPTLDAIPLPTTPVCEKIVTDDQSGLFSAESTAAVDSSSTVDQSVTSVSRVGDAVHAKTSVGTITVLLNRKLGPRLNRVSIFDGPDDNVKEVNRKLLKLRRLKKMKKGKDGGQNESEVGSVTGRKALQQRISEWKEELLNDPNYKSKHRDAKGPLVTAGLADGRDKHPDKLDDGLKTEAKDQIPALMVSEIKTEAVDSKLLPSQKSDDAYMMKLYDSFMKVASSSDLVQLDWPREMVQETRLAPKLVYSCNPLYFSFRKLQLLTQQNSENREDSKKHKHQRKRKKSRVGKVDDNVAGPKDLNSKDKLDSHKTQEDQTNITKEHTKMAKNLLDHRLKNRKTKKSAVQTGKASITSSHSTQYNNDKHQAAADESQKHGSGRLLQSTQPTVADDDLAHLTAKLKDTGKSRWDTSSDSELETAQVGGGDRKTREVVRRSKVPASSDRTKTHQHSPDDHSRSPTTCHWSSHSSERSRNRSQDWSRSSSASSYSRSSSSYRSSSYSYRRRRRRRVTYDSSWSSCSYSDSGSDYSQSSRSYTRSRSVSRRRRWLSRSYSRSRSSSKSCSPLRHRSGSQLRPHKNRSDWRSQTTPKRPVAEPTSAQQKKATMQSAKASKNKSTEDAGSEIKNNSNDVKSAATDTAGGTVSSAEVKDLKLVNSEEWAETVTEAAVEDVKCIPTPEEHMQSIPLPVPEQPQSNRSFIGPVLPSSHPLAHKQDIPLPATAKFQCIGPNDPLVFHSMPPPPPPPASLTNHNRAGPSLVPLPQPPSPPADDMDDIAGDEDPIPQMLDVRTLKPATFIPPEQDEQYGALRRQAELHARRQQIRAETGMDIADDEDEDSTEAVADEQLADQAYVDEPTAAMFSTTPVIQVPQHHLVGQPLSTSVAMMAPGAGLVPVQMVPAAGGGLVGLEPGLVPLVQQAQTPPTLLAISPAAAALARAQEEAEAEAQMRQQVAAAQAIAAAQRQRTAELVRLIPGGRIGVGAISSPALAALRPAGVSLQAVPLQAFANQQPQQQLIQLPTGRIVSVQPNVIPSGVQVIAQPQPAPLVIGPNGTVLRLIR